VCFRFPRRALAAFTAAGLALAVAAPASALSLTNLGVALGAGNSAQIFNDAAATSDIGLSQVSVLSSSALAFDARYAMDVGVDIGNAATRTVNYTSQFVITFDVTADPGENWALTIDTSRMGALTLVNDGSGPASATLNGVTGSLAGAGTLAGSLDLAAVGTLAGNNGGDQPFSQTGSATITGTGTGAAQAVTLTFDWTSSTTSTRGRSGANRGDEAAIRMGIDSAMTSFTADDYPGVGNRTIGNDGFFVSGSLVSLGPSPVPEPGSLLMMLAGLVGLALFGRPTPR
jgi:hypothetical protein